MLTLLKWLPFLGKLAGLSKFLAFIPGGQIFALIGSVIGGVVQAITWFFRWLLADILDAVKEWQRALVRVTCGLAILAVGVHQGIKHDARKVESARQEVRLVTKERDQARAENGQWRERYAAEETRAKQAEVARAEAEARVRAAAAKRVRQPSPGSATPAPAKAAPQSSLFSFPALFGQPK